MSRGEKGGGGGGRKEEECVRRGGGVKGLGGGVGGRGVCGGGGVRGGHCDYFASLVLGLLSGLSSSPWGVPLSHRDGPYA